MYKVFINNKEIRITNQLPVNKPHNSKVVTIKNKKDFISTIEGFLNNLEKNKDVLHIFNKEPNTVLSYLEDYATLIEAAGGLVTNPFNELLFIFRYGKWDLPKGKKEPYENTEITATREVEEECGIGNIEIIDLLPETYHMYLLPSEQWALKRTTWYLMHTRDWENPKPQIEEDISEVVWVSPSNVKKYLSNTYPNIKMLVEKYLEGLRG